MPTTHLRPALDDDRAFLAAMLAEAFNWSPDHPPIPIADLLSSEHIALYVDGWKRAGDVGVIAESATGSPVGAAWYRQYTQASHGYGFVDESTPEITIGVIAGARGRGIGRRLMEDLIQQASGSGLHALSLSVEPHNVPARSLYERLGFQRVGEVGGSWTMRLVLPS